MKTITCASFNHIQLLSSMNQHCVYNDGICTLSNVVIMDPMWVDLFPRFCVIQGFATLMQFKPREKTMQLTPHWSSHLFSNWGIWLLTETCRCAFTRLCQCHLEFKMVKRPSSFYLGHFFWSKIFNHITKDANILHLKSDSKCRLNYFLISTPSRHTSRHHDDLLQAVDF
jgi:hypothetical protein